METNEKTGNRAEPCMWVPDTEIAPRQAHETEEERDKRLWREEMSAAGIVEDDCDETENTPGRKQGEDMYTVLLTLPKSNAPAELSQDMDALTRLWGMITEMWYDYKRGTIKWGHLSTTEYNRRWNVGTRPVMHFAEVLLRSLPPTIEDARHMAELNVLHRRTLPSRSDRANAITDVNELRAMNAGWSCMPGRPQRDPNSWDESTAIAFLKSKGYKVMKSMKANVEY